MTTITALPTPPSRQDPTNFNDRADAFLSALPQFATEANLVASETNIASTNAVNANQAVIAATNITKWVSGTTYANGAVVWSPINGLGYRRITASGSGTTDPSLDTTNYKQVNGTGDVSTSGNQSITGIKTFTSGISLGVDLAITDGGTGASTAAAAFSNLKQDASTSTTGVVALATDAEAQAGSDTTKAITSSTLRSGINATGSAPIYAARAWVNFNGTGTVAIRASGNVSSITDNGVGDYTINFTTATQDANYSTVATCEDVSGGGTGFTSALLLASSTAQTTSSVRVRCRGEDSHVKDCSVGSVAIFR